MIRTILAALTLVCATRNAEARPRHTTSYVADQNCNILWPCEGVGPTARGLQIERAMPFGKAVQRYMPRVSSLGAPTPNFGYSSSTLVDRARQFMGGNPTGWSRVWCGRFMAMIAPNAAARIRNPNLARDWATLPQISPQVGAVAVLSRGRRGGHVGVVTGFTAGGDPIIVSGNHGRRVGEGVYSRSRVIAYVSAS